MQNISLNIAPFNATLIVHINSSMVKCHNYITKKHNCKLKHDPLEQDAASLYLIGEDGPIWIILLTDDFNDSDLVHEIFHTIYSVTKYVDIKLSNSSEEYFAYAMGDLFERIKQKVKVKSTIDFIGEEIQE